MEMTAYVLLAYLTMQPAPSQEELSFASLIAKWISSQQNPNGGFSSTQVSCFRPAASHTNVRRWEVSDTQVGAQGGSPGQGLPCSVYHSCQGPKRLVCQVVPLGMTDIVVKDLAFLTQWGRTVGTQGTCVCAIGVGSHTNFSVHMKLLPHPVVSK